MKTIFKITGIYLVLILSTGCATAPLPEPKLFIDQAVWSDTKKDKVYSACLSALTIEGYAIHPMGTNKDVGLIVTQSREFNFQNSDDIMCYYTLQIIITEIQDNKVMINVNAVNAGYKWENSYEPSKPYLKHYMNEKVADHIDKFYNQLDILLGKAENYKRDKSLF